MHKVDKDMLQAEPTHCLENAESILKERLGKWGRPSLAIVTGSGLGSLARMGKELDSLPYSEIPCLAGDDVSGHEGRWIVLDCDGLLVHCLAGRRHLYEGVTPEQATLTVRLLARMGVKRLILTNAVGGINPRLRVGDLMLIIDHINLMFRNPLIGSPGSLPKNPFVDMSEPYDRGLCDKLRKASMKLSIHLKEGVYVAQTGPTYETWAEVRRLHALGGDVVGMSTVPEVLVARQEKMRVAGVSVVTNTYVAGRVPPSHEEVLESSKQAAGRLKRLLKQVVKKMAARKR